MISMSLEKKRKNNEKNSDDNYISKKNEKQYLEQFMDYVKEENFQDALKIFTKISEDAIKKQAYMCLPEIEKYRFIGRFKSPQLIAELLSDMEDSKRNKTMRFIMKQYKGNNKKILEIINCLNFCVTIPQELLTINLNNTNVLSISLLKKIQRNVINYNNLTFKINEDDDSRNIEYKFGEMYAIISKIEELTADLTPDMSEADRFFIIYSRIIKSNHYDYQYLRKEKHIKRRDIFNYSKNIKELRRENSGLYGGLINGISIFSGESLILHEVLQYAGIKSQYVYGYGKDSGHAWVQVQIDGKWYNTDPTWDSSAYRCNKNIKYMLLDDEKFEKSHGKYNIGRPRTYHKCNSKFDYTKITNLSLEEISTEREDLDL